MDAEENRQGQPSSGSSKTPIAVCHAVSLRLGACVAYWRAQGHTIDRVDCVWARLPGELLRCVFECLHPASLASLLVAGSRALMHAAVCTNDDLVVDALWWHLWNLPDVMRLNTTDSAMCFLDQRMIAPVSGADADCVLRAAWIYATPTASHACAYSNPIAIDSSHPAHALDLWSGRTAGGVTYDPDGVAALALSCARSCSDRAFTAIVDLAARSHGCARFAKDAHGRLLRACDKNGRAYHENHELILTHLIAQFAYAGRAAFLLSWFESDHADCIDDWGTNHLACVDDVAFSAAIHADSETRNGADADDPAIALARRFSAQCNADRLSCTRYGCACSDTAKECDKMPFDWWLPAAVVALDLQRPERAKRLIGFGLRMALTYAFARYADGSWCSETVGRMVLSLCDDRRYDADVHRPDVDEAEIATSWWSVSCFFHHDQIVAMVSRALRFVPWHYGSVVRAQVVHLVADRLVRMMNLHDMNPVATARVANSILAQVGLH
ncbi:hypothetical protein pneo_cds_1015 [Pandoravirus neocaledonia]|uniref:F-box domain containing protein n=1 Tax=Pandoravirus neocaledonia TaxID=2107708 RepID=A0A2U7UDY6_9VIRU|nr:hypothetical protein pneo_cds_1015 [Pandoravirus neocaledonia]AVK76622.1 hypothetical protein pneo_cds_1015 [Pandoravirus neocaledonia]